jgi:ankyrin repeat protein
MNWKWLGMSLALILAIVGLDQMWTARRSSEEFLSGSAASQLINAAGTGDTTTVRALLDKGTDVNTKDGSFGHTALILAARQGHTATVRALLDKGADVNAQDNYGFTALWWAMKNGHTEIVQLLKQAGAGEQSTPAMQAVQETMEVP